MICASCIERILDDRFVTMFDPNFPTDYTKVKYYHSKGKCEPRISAIPQRHSQWLIEYNLQRTKNEINIKSLE